MPARVPARDRRRGHALRRLPPDEVRVRDERDRRLAARGPLLGHAHAPEDPRGHGNCPARWPGSAARARSETSRTSSTRARRASRGAAFGYTGIVVAALARYNPLAVVLVAVLIGGLQNAGLYLQGADFPTGPRRRPPGDHPLLHARRRAARSATACASGGVVPRRRRRAVIAAALNDSLVVLRPHAGCRLRHADPLCRARRAPRGALWRAQPRRRGDDAGSGAVMGFWASQHAAGVVERRALPRRGGWRRSRRSPFSLIHAFLTITLRASQIVSYLAPDDLLRGPRAVVVPRKLRSASRTSRRSTSSRASTCFGSRRTSRWSVPLLFYESALVYVSWLFVVVGSRST